MNLKKFGLYRTRSGGIATIYHIDENCKHPMHGQVFGQRIASWQHNGRYSTQSESEFDLISEINPVSVLPILKKDSWYKGCNGSIYQYITFKGINITIYAFCENTNSFNTPFAVSEIFARDGVLVAKNLKKTIKNQ